MKNEQIKRKWHITGYGICAAAMMLIAGQTVSAQVIAGDDTWELSDDGAITISSSAARDYANRADVPWYNYMSSIRSAAFEEGTTYIGTYVLNDAVSLEEVSIPEGVTGIGLRAMSNCSSLTSLNLPETLESIDYWGLCDCDSLEEIVFPAGMKEISNYTLQDCNNIKKIVVQGEVKRIGYDAFEDCTSLECVYLPETIETIDLYALHGCNSLTDIYFAGTEAEWQQVDLTDNTEIVAGLTIHYGAESGSVEVLEQQTQEAPETDNGAEETSEVCFPYSGEEYYDKLAEICLLSQGIVVSRTDGVSEDGHSIITASGKNLRDIDIISNDNGDLLEAQVSAAFDISSGAVNLVGAYLTGNEVGMSLAAMVTASVYREKGMTEAFVNELQTMSGDLENIAKHISDSLSTDPSEFSNGETVFEEVVGDYGKAIVSVVADAQNQYLSLACRWVPIS